MKKMKKVLVLMTDSYAGFGGIAQYNRDVLNSLISCDSISEIKSIVRLSHQTEVNIPKKLIEYCVFNKFFYICRTLKEVIKNRPDIILCGHIHLMPLAVAAGMLRSVPVIMEIYGIDAWYDKGWLNRFLIKKVSHVISISRFTKKRFLAWSLFDEEKVTIITNAINLDQYVMSEKKPDYLIERYSLLNKRVLLTLGRLSTQERYKGHDRIIYLIPKLIQVYSDFIYIIAGDGDDLMRLKGLIKKLNVENFVRFAGRIDEKEMLDHYSVADAFAMPSTGEGFGFVFLEAAACGLPILGGGTDGSADALLDGKLGLMIDPNNKKELLNGLIVLLKKPTKSVQRELLKKFSVDYFRIEIINSFNMVFEAKS